MIDSKIAEETFNMILELATSHMLESLMSIGYMTDRYNPEEL